MLTLNGNTFKDYFWILYHFSSLHLSANIYWSFFHWTAGTDTNIFI